MRLTIFILVDFSEKWGRVGEALQLISIWSTDASVTWGRWGARERRRDGGMQVPRPGHSA